MFTQTVEYALRATVWLAQHRDQPQTRHQIALATQTPPDYLAKVLRTMVRGGLVHAGRGLGGGFMLARPPATMTLLDVVNTVEPIRRIRGCPLGLASHRGQLCPVHAKLDQALATVECSFASTSIAELLGQKDRPTPLCEMGACA